MKRVLLLFVLISAISCNTSSKKNLVKTGNKTIKVSLNQEDFKGETSYDSENKLILFKDASGSYEIYKNNDYYSLLTILKDNKSLEGSNSITVSFRGERVTKGTGNLPLIKMSTFSINTSKDKYSTIIKRQLNDN
ncbi:MAG: hypothetical protein COB98_00765 [Flavobacteriaceae bacterium]|nr:MAG: hypothetical protein COB98_00765 [Flavobacteriaceae bacterium]